MIIIIIIVIVIIIIIISIIINLFFLIQLLLNTRSALFHNTYFTTAYNEESYNNLTVRYNN